MLTLQEYAKRLMLCASVGDECDPANVVAVNDGVGQAGDGGTRNATYGASKGRSQCKRP